MLADQIRILNDQYTKQMIANERQVKALGSQIQDLKSRLHQLELRR